MHDLEYLEKAAIGRVGKMAVNFTGRWEGNAPSTQNASKTKDHREAGISGEGGGPKQSKR